LQSVLEVFPDVPSTPLAADIHGALHMIAAFNPRCISDAEMKACLRRLIDSVKFHGGGRNYLMFLLRHLPG
jgi:hypothetical protein